MYVMKYGIYTHIYILFILRANNSFDLRARIRELLELLQLLFIIALNLPIPLYC